MIYIERPPAPSFLADVNGKWHRETQQAIAHYANGASASFEFSLYNNVGVKDELRKIFVKCAYCESNYGAVFDGDVEHFRPKGKINEKTPQTPGYYWLANDWENLFLACQHCNQCRKHILYNETERRSLGKLDQFPLAQGREHQRMLSPIGDFGQEEDARLLINPCKEDPTAHLSYEPEEAVIVPLTLKGKKSVEVLVLQRPLLVQERKKRLYEVSKQIRRVKRELERMNQQPGDLAAQAEFEDEFADLLRFTENQAPYAGMCRFFVKKFLADNHLL